MEEISGPLLLLAVLAAAVVAVFVGMAFYYNDIASKCIAAGMQWIANSCVR